MAKAVVVLHGFMNKSFIMKYLGFKLNSSEYKVYYFGYNTRKYSDKTLMDLDKFISSLKESEVYLVGHSMGGLVIRNYLHSESPRPEGLDFSLLTDKECQSYNIISKIMAVVTIASPHYESITAHNVKKKFRGFLGNAGESGLTKELNEWSSEIPVGCIAGVNSSKISKNLFLFFSDKKSLNDGTIFIEEALLKNSKDSIILKGSHTGLLFKKEVAMQTLYFLNNLKFKHM